MIYGPPLLALLPGWRARLMRLRRVRLPGGRQAAEKEIISG